MAKIRRRPRYNLKNLAGSNPKCPSYGKWGKGNILSNGTYRTKEGKKVRRFLCKICGESFCSKAGTIFHDLRTPQEKVILALKILVKGMPLRGVSEVLEVKLGTVKVIPG